MKFLFTTVLVAIVLTAYGQTKISGRVHDMRGEGVPGANIFLLDTYDGTSSSGDGKFEFNTHETGTYVLVVKFIGFKEFRREIVLINKPVIVEINLIEEINELEAVTITAGAFTASDEKRRTVFRAIDIATTAGATADIAGALNTLPGTQKVGESGRLFVRGGDGNETRTFIDGMVVLDAYGPSAPNTPSRGRFLPFMFKGTSFSTGGYSAEYGQALSSALVLDSKDQSEESRTDIGILSVGADVAHTQAWASGSAAGKIQYTNIRPYFGLINQEVDWKTPPESIEASAAFRQKVGKRGMVKFFGNFNHTDYQLYNHDIDNTDIKQLYDLTNSYRYLNGSYKNSLNDNWIVRGGVSYTYQQNNTFLDADHALDTEQGIHVKSVFEGSLSEKVELKTGIEAISRNYYLNYSPENGPAINRAFDELITAAFVEGDLYTSNRFVTRGGARLEYNNLNQALHIDPRISFAYKTGKVGQVSMAYGVFRQSPKNDLLRVNDQLDAEKSEHFILNYQRIENNRTFRIETYYKKYASLVKYINGNAYDLNNAGSGYAQGIELFWRDNQTIRNVDYWVSYSYLRTERDYLDFPYRTTPTFASGHNFSIVYKHFIAALKSQVGATYSFTSGRPYNDPNEEKFNHARTPAYRDLSFNWSYLPKPYLIVYFSCTNVLGRDNIFGYEFSGNMNAEGLYNSRAIRQPAPRFIFLGIFITLSKNKTVNQLPSL
ncbi:MAG: TonB-dependent receptor [Cyclobacteriaceae bacterium]|nr:TonB-dependent receptor [Cyclobacteriaceae bacterium]